MTWLICDVISNIITAVDRVWVTAPLHATAPTVAYAPGIILVNLPPYLTPTLYLVFTFLTVKRVVPVGNHVAISSPPIRPKAAPALKLGMNAPQGIGIVDAKIDAKN